MADYFNTSILSEAPVSNCTREASKCRQGVVLPVWMPEVQDVTGGDLAARAIVYALGLAYMFLGVSIIADRFMAAIEVITSQERKITVIDSAGNKQTVMVRYWNETVSNLTLMALGSSAPEILLSIIEIFGQGFEAGELGPNTIVGSAAYNLFVIIGYCILVVPNGEIRRIKHLRVFFVTATWSVFAYIWLYIILSVSSYGVVDFWEALLTFLFFPLTVLSAYLVDRKIFLGNFLQKKFRGTKLLRGADGDEEAGPASQPLKAIGPSASHNTSLAVGENTNDEDTTAADHPDAVSSVNNPEIRHFEEHRREYLNILKELRQKNPDISIDELQKLAEVEILKRGPKSRAYYRIQATRKLIGGTSNVKKKMIEKDKIAYAKSKSNLESIVENPEEKKMVNVYFEPAHYTCFESVGSLELFVVRSGGDLNSTVLVDFKTESGTAEANSDFEFTAGTLEFGPGETQKHFVVKIIDDDVYEEDEHFYARLTNARYKSLETASGQQLDPTTVKVANPDVATVMILDDDHCGVFVFMEPRIEVIENCGTLRVKVTRTSGARGKVKVPFKTVDGTAKGGQDYEKKEGVLIFYNNEVEKFIDIEIVDDEDYEKKEVFFIELGEPISEFTERNEEINEGGKPKLGENSRVEVHIKESKAIKGIIDKLLINSNASAILVGTSSWREQFAEALRVTVDDDDDDDDGGDEGGSKNGEEKKEGGEQGDEPAKPEKEPKQPTCSDYLIHFISLFWKILFAFVPPTEIWGGWACFVVSIIIIGLLTAVIGDLASHFGCTIGLKDSVTAISFVALGTSLPDTFASKVAAVQDKYADSSVGNVTGSNAVNVFLGIGLAWLAASTYHLINGTVFVVHPGSLAFSVTLFCSFAVLAIMLMMLRRLPMCGGELGGPKKIRIITSSLFFGLWILYLTLSSLESYCVIKGF